MTGYCRICRGQRDSVTVSGKLCCSGCGTTQANAFVPRPESKQSKPRCPKCRSQKSVEFDGRLMCAECKAVFETVEVGFLDSRPEQNAEKRGL